MPLIIPRIWIKRIVYAWLIIWVGGISPLIYFGDFSSHQGVQSQISFLQQSDRSHKLQLALAEISAKQHMEQQLIRLLSPNTDYFNATTHQIMMMTSTLYQGFIWVEEHTLPFNTISLIGWVGLLVLLGSSVWLPPPEKPPPFSIQF